MVVDKIENAKLYENLSPLIKKAFASIENTDFNKLELGKHVIEGDKLFFIVQEYETKDLEEGKIEAHRKYLDIQLMISGSELIGVTPLLSQTILKPYNEEDDYILFEGNTSMLKLAEGQFALFFPEDLHMPGIKIQDKSRVKKVVFKVLF
ncbi:MAG TPA: YhcH/YjgK/YiaL family protein [Cytophagaceae bacterium]|jgi:YhcH/YjgK/YiaL family protein|nr:YhcH/YjgK/YiaL family protein [Cytophagaceae bacterium]